MAFWNCVLRKDEQIRELNLTKIAPIPPGNDRFRALTPVYFIKRAHQVVQPS